MRVFLFVCVLILTFTVTAFTQSGSAKAIFAEATRDAREGRFEQALKKYRAISVSEKDIEFAAKVHFNIGVCLYRLGETEHAISEYQATLKLNAKYQKAFYALGMAYSDLGRGEQAKAAFFLAVALDKNDSEAWFDLGMVLLGEKDYDAAKRAFENVIKNKSGSAADALNNLGVIAALNGDLLEAEKQFQSALVFSRGASTEAAENLRICRALNKGMIAALTFSRRINGSGE